MYDKTAKEGDIIELRIDPSELMLPDHVKEESRHRVEGRFDGPETVGVEVEMSTGLQTPTFRIPDSCYEVVERG